MRTSSPMGMSGDVFWSRSTQQFITLAVFTVALFLSALLLFVVQPMFAKIILPVLGGAPSVWAVAMVFFQSALLLGYAYAHGLTRWCPHKYAPLVHIGFMIVAGSLLPLSIASGWTEAPAEGIHLWVFALFAVSIGLPFMALSANGPLLQAWFSRTGHPHSEDPYFLYGSSNTGSLLALLLYPVAFEPLMTLHQQTWTWSSGYWLLAFFIGACGLLMVFSRTAEENEAADALAAVIDANAKPITMKDRAFWIGLAAVPSALLIGVTNHMTTDVAAIPFLWVLPLALFLLTFIIVFQRQPILSHSLMRQLQPLAAVILLVSFFLPVGSFWLVHTVVHLGAFFVFAMVCHGELVKRRPTARNLTQFYLFMSFGGMIGGLLAGLIAPNVFSTAAEYPIAICLSLLAARSIWVKSPKVYKKEAIFFGVGFAALIVVPKLVDIRFDYLAGFMFSALIGLLVILFVGRRRPLRVASAFSLALMAIVTTAEGMTDTIYLRGFYGINSIVPHDGGKYRALAHGTTIHGMQLIDDPVRKATGRPKMVMYYHNKSGFADAMKAVRVVTASPTVAVVGLGTGALACYSQPNEKWTFFEIDPLVVQIARNKEHFTYLSDCGQNTDIVLGDARIKLTKQPDGTFDFMIIDAFSSDVVPAHLLTIEAMKTYLNKISEDGLLLMHISNRYAELRPVLGAAARELGLKAMWSNGVVEKDMEERGLSRGLVVALSRNDKVLDNLKTKSHWEPLTVANKVPWSDDYSNMLGAIWAKKPEDK